MQISIFETQPFPRPRTLADQRWVVELELANLTEDRTCDLLALARRAPNPAARAWLIGWLQSREMLLSILRPDLVARFH